MHEQYIDPQAAHINRTTDGACPHLEKLSSSKKMAEKALIPLPPTGSASLFCAKASRGANTGSAQARCGVCGRCRDCT